MLLAGGDDRRQSAVDFRLRREKKVQKVDLWRGAFPAIFDRGNKVTVVTFKSHRFFETIEDAFAFIVKHAEEVSSSGILTLETNYANKIVSRYMKDAKVTIVEEEQRGAMTIHSYEVIGTELVSKL